jgi:hypothetical protein
LGLNLVPTQRDAREAFQLRNAVIFLRRCSSRDA